MLTKGITIYILLLFSSFNIFAQTKKEAKTELSKIESTNDLELLKQKHQNWLIYTHSSSHEDKLTTIKDSIFMSKNEYEIFEYNGSMNKILSKEIKTACKVRYIYLNGKNHSLKEINSLRKKIIADYYLTEDFQKLYDQYNEDGGDTGIMDWFYEDQVVKPFFNGVKNKDKGAIFTLDVPENNWYYVVLKLEENKKIEVTETISISIDD